MNETRYIQKKVGKHTEGLSNEGEGEAGERERFVARAVRKEGECMSMSMATI